MANDYLPVKRRIYFANNSSQNSIVDGAAAALAEKRLLSSQRILLQVFHGGPKIASDMGHMPNIYFCCILDFKNEAAVQGRVGWVFMYLSILTLDGQQYSTRDDLNQTLPGIWLL